VLALMLSLATGTGAIAVDLRRDDFGRDMTPAQQQAQRRWDDLGRQGVVAVGERSRPDYQPDGLRAGNFLVFPALGTTVVLDDNVYATSTHRRSDVRIDVLPSVRIVSELPRHVLDFDVGARLSKYGRHSDLDTNDVYGSVNGTLHFDHAHTLSVSVLSALEHDSGLLPQSPRNVRERTPIWHNRAKLGARRDAGRLYGTFALGGESWDYQDVRAWDGSRIDQDFRDLAIFSAQGMLGYRFSPGFELQGKVRALRQLNRGNATIDTDAWGYEALGGLVLQSSPLLRYHLLGGFGIRDWDRPGSATAATGLLEGEVQWLVSSSLTATLTGRRKFAEGPTEDIDTGMIESSAAAKLAYEAWRNLVFTFGGEYRDAELIGQDRRDHSYIGRAEVEYLMNKSWQLTLGFEHLERRSNVSTFDLTRNRVWLGAKLKF
jgi:hypothetical protein